MTEWNRSTLGNECTIILGQSPPSSEYNYEKKGLPFYQGNKDFGKITPTPTVWTDYDGKKAIENDVLISVRAPVGALNIATEDCIIGRGLTAVRYDNHKYVYYYLEHKKENLRSKSTGSTFSAITKKVLTDFEFIFPNSSKKQQQIVDEIEKQLTRLDAAVKELRAVKEKLELYRKSVLKAAFDTDCEYKTIGELFGTTSGGTPRRGTKEYYQGSISWLKSGELEDNLFIHESEEKITHKAVQESSAKIFPPKTVLIAMYGATTGKLGLLRKESSTNQAICAILPNQNFLPEFIFYYLLNKRQDLVRQGKGGAQPNINQGIIKSTLFPVVSLDIQKSILSQIEVNFSIINNIEETLESSLIKAEKLRKSILKSAFEGKLI